MTDREEVKSVLLELAKDEGWTWERLDVAVTLAMRDIEDEAECHADAPYERADNNMMRRQEDDMISARNGGDDAT